MIKVYIKDTLSPDPPPHLCGRWLSTLRPHCTRTSQLQDRLRWRGIWGHWPHGQHQWDMARNAPYEDLWWNQSEKEKQRCVKRIFGGGCYITRGIVCAQIPGCWQPHAQCHVWCRRADRSDGRFHRQCPDLRMQHHHGCEWTSPKTKTQQMVPSELIITDPFTIHPKSTKDVQILKFSSIQILPNLLVMLWSINGPLSKLFCFNKLKINY